eukprot:200557-Pleurochrysis_carterae.AAC.1
MDSSKGELSYQVRLAKTLVKWRRQIQHTHPFPILLVRGASLKLRDFVSDSSRTVHQHNPTTLLTALKRVVYAGRARHETKIHATLVRRAQSQADIPGQGSFWHPATRRRCAAGNGAGRHTDYSAPRERRIVPSLAGESGDWMVPLIHHCPYKY